MGAVATCKYAPECERATKPRRPRNGASSLRLPARADQQHEWVLTGDPRGTYGTTFAGPRDIWSGTHSRVASRSEGQCARHGKSPIFDAACGVVAAPDPSFDSGVQRFPSESVVS